VRDVTLTQDLVFVLVNGLLFGSLIALTAVGLSLIYGVLGVPNFAQGEFATFAGLGTVVLAGYVGLVPAMVLAIVATFVLGIASERLVFSKFYGRDRYLLLSFFVSFGLVVTFEELLVQLIGGDVYQVGMPQFGSFAVAGVSVSYLQVLAALVAVVMLAALYLFTRYTYYGLAMRAIENDPKGAEAVGIEQDRIYMLTFGLGAALTGITGVLYGSLFTLFPSLGLELTGFAFTIIVVGGVGSFSGAIVASLAVGLVESATATFVGSRYRLFAIFLILFLVLIVRPGGLGGEIDG
jgi:branched-chain amino acid transport system permease protein